MISVAVVWAALHVGKSIARASGLAAEILGTEYEKAYIPFDELMEAFDDKFDVFGEDELVLASDFDYEEDDDGNA